MSQLGIGSGGTDPERYGASRLAVRYEPIVALIWKQHEKTAAASAAEWASWTISNTPSICEKSLPLNSNGELMVASP
jgi:hypothetical protein